MSDLPWVDCLPRSWPKSRGKHLFNRMQRPVRPEDDVVTAFRDGQVTLRSLRRAEGYTFSNKEIGYQGIRAGDLVIHQMDAFAGAIGVSEADGKSTPVYTVLQPRRDDTVDNRFYMYLLRHLAKSDYILSLAKGIRERSTDFRWAELAELELPVPPKSIQQDIVDYLDSETARIDALIDHKQRFIDLLLEKRGALITNAVTKGLDPNVEMKDSGVSWIGMIPTHWEAARIKQVARLESGHTPSRQHPEYWTDCTVPWITTSEVWQVRDGRAEYIADTKEKVSELGLANSSARKLPAGTVVLSRTASVGFSAIMPVDMATSQDFANWVPGPRVTSEFLLYTFRSMRHEFDRLMMGSTHQTIYMPDIQKFSMPLPPVNEQGRIVEFIRTETRRLDDVVDKTRRSIDLLREYRTALISAAVTGQIDLPGTEASEEVA